MQTATIKQFIETIGLNPLEMEINKAYEVQGYQVESLDMTSGEVVWNDIKKVIKKENSIRMHLQTKDFSLCCAPDHRVFVKLVDGEEKFFEEVGVLFENEEDFVVLTKNGLQAFQISREDETEIYDIEVEKSHCYFSNGILSHNTLYGSPDTTTGGTAIPFWSSLRVKISNPSPIKRTLGSGEEIIGVSVSAKVIKNKVERPWREVSFNILFEEGISESDDMFDTVREYCDRNKDNPVLVNGKKVAISGTGAWKEFSVTDPTTGEVMISDKFHKSEFKNKILDNPAYQIYVKAVLDATYIIGSNDAGHITLGKPDSDIEAENIGDSSVN